MWQLFLMLSIAVLLVGIALAIFSVKRKGIQVSPVKIVMCAVFVSNTLIFVPMYYKMLGNDVAFSSAVKTILISLHHAIRLFIVDSDFDMIKEIVPQADAWLYAIYTSFTAVLFLLSPVMTFGFIFSFFKDVTAHRKYLFSYNKEVYIFSDLNEASVELASSIKAQFKEAVIVFAKNTDDSSVQFLMDKVADMDAILYEKDLLLLNFGFHSKKKNINFLVLGSDEEKNLKNALELIEKYDGYKNVQLYVLLSGIEGELLLNIAQKKEIKVRRISDVSTMVFNNLKKTGALLFEEAKSDDAVQEKKISVLVVGLGKYGGEMTKSLAWFCQMEGYRVEIDAFDANPAARERFISSCPELMDDNHNNKFEDFGEARYRIGLHCPTDACSVQFDDAVKNLKDTTYVFVSLGDDETNIRISIKLRMLFEQMGIAPRIQAVVESTERKRILEGMRNFSGQAYDIDFVGTINEIYSYENILNSELEKEALRRHLCWGDEASFWGFEYNYKSSMASAVHRRMKIACNIPGADKPGAERTDAEKQALRMMEHRRWNAYMRAQGYVYAEKRNNMAKTHHCLVTFDLLSQKDKEKDDD